MSFSQGKTCFLENVESAHKLKLYGAYLYSLIQINECFRCVLLYCNVLFLIVEGVDASSNIDKQIVG